MTQEEFNSRYEIDFVHPLGEGSFGTVYKAYDNILGTWIAVKISKVRHHEGKKISLINEFNTRNKVPIHQALANYDAVYEFQTNLGLYNYGIMQYYDKGNLKDLMDSKKLKVEEISNIFIKLLNGINHLHKNKVIHRDIKPSNILCHIDPRGELFVKISDFGISKVVNFNNTAYTSSLAGGTIDYASPEQLRGEEVGFNTDIWSLGVILFEMFANKKPFGSLAEHGNSELSRLTVIENIVRGEISPEVSNIPQPFQDIIIKCLQKDRRNRFTNCDEILSQFEGKKRALDTVLIGSQPAKVKKSIKLSEINLNFDLIHKIKKYKELVIGGGVFILFIFLGIFAYNRTKSIHIFEEGTKYGISNGWGMTIKSPMYDTVFYDSNNSMIARQYGSEFYIDKNGNFIEVTK
ncbi:MAG TPA: serine/threonine-protein kinase [Saprospiraceae bacterium]|nr:serine/threonine-protein kinase [Saprospiraceae bacterium]